MRTRKAEIRIGCSGYQYDHWKGVFYPEDLPKKRWFEHYAEHFDTVEINNTFYRLPAEKTFVEWHDQAPANFRYALKFSRYGTHIKRLKDPEQPVELFVSRAEPLKSFLGPILAQLPPKWGPEVERLDAFLREARGNRWSVEFRDPRWLTEDVFEVLEKRRAALCIHDMLEDHPWRTTTDWVYLRFHGSPEHDGDYSEKELRGIAKRLRAFHDDGLDIWAYFNNDIHGHAVKNALRLRELMKGGK